MEIIFLPLNRFIILPLFAFTTILAWSYYGEKAMDFCFRNASEKTRKIATKVFTFKADYAEATGTHNTGTANFVQSLYNTPVPAQKDDERVRTTIYGHPGVIFHKKDASSDPVFVGRYICPH